MRALEDRFLSRIDGPETVVRYFRRARAGGRLAHAYLFTGPQGAGKRRFAAGLARALLCPTGEPCDACPSCHAAEHGNHGGLEVYSSERSRAAIDIQEVRALSQRDHRRHRDLRIWIIEDCEGLSGPASNALLRTLEEPSPGTLLVLVAPSTGSILPTLVSRCQRIQFPGRTRSPGEADGDPAPATLLAQVRDPRFFAERDPKEWLAAAVPDASSQREALSRLLDGLTARVREEWKSLERLQQGGGPDLAPLLETLLEFRDHLDGNANADLVLEALLASLRRAPATAFADRASP